MAYAPYGVAKGGFTTVTSARERPGFFRRLFNAMVVSRQLQADREIDRYLRNSKFTDEAEREIERRFLSLRTHCPQPRCSMACSASISFAARS